MLSLKICYRPEMVLLSKFCLFWKLCFKNGTDTICKNVLNYSKCSHARGLSKPYNIQTKSEQIFKNVERCIGFWNFRSWQILQLSFHKTLIFSLVFRNFIRSEQHNFFVRLKHFKNSFTLFWFIDVLNRYFLFSL